MSPKKNKYLFQLNHPAHFHLFKHSIDKLKERGHEVLITVKDKDILLDLLAEHEYVKVSKGYRKKNFAAIIKSLYQRNKKLLKVVKAFKPDLMIGTSPEIGQIRYFTKSPAIFFGEDDVNLSTIMLIGAMSCYPFFDSIVSPIGVNNGVWKRKTTFYQGFQKLAYLHPNRFVPDRSKVHITEGEKYFLLRFANLSAYHDVNATGINDTIARELIEILQPHGSVLITSERALSEDLEKFRFKGNIHDIHHYLYFANLFIGDSQSMAVEASVLGTPNIRYNDFVGKISVLEDLEVKYKLTQGIHTSDKHILFSSVRNLIQNPNLLSEHKLKRKQMLEEKIDVTGFMLWFFENYPESVTVMKENPDFQNHFLEC